MSLFSLPEPPRQSCVLPASTQKEYAVDVCMYAGKDEVRRTGHQTGGTNEALVHPASRICQGRPIGDLRDFTARFRSQ